MKLILVLVVFFSVLTQTTYSQVGELTYDLEGNVLDAQKYDSTNIVIDISLKDSILEWCCLNRYTDTKYYMTCYITSYTMFTDDDGINYYSFKTIRDGDALEAEFILQLDHNSYTFIPNFTYDTNIHHYVAGGPGVKLTIFN